MKRRTKRKEPRKNSPRPENGYAHNLVVMPNLLVFRRKPTHKKTEKDDWLSQKFLGITARGSSQFTGVLFSPWSPQNRTSFQLFLATCFAFVKKKKKGLSFDRQTRWVACACMPIQTRRGDTSAQAPGPSPDLFQNRPFALYYWIFANSFNRYTTGVPSPQVANGFGQRWINWVRLSWP